MTPGFENDTATATQRRIVTPRAGTLRNLYIYFNAAPGAANATILTFTLTVNGVATALTVSRAANAGIGFTANLVNTVAVVSGDTISLSAAYAANIGSGALGITATCELA
jgi:hypothetical protein